MPKERDNSLTAQRLSESLRKERDAFKKEREALEAQVERLMDDKMSLMS